MTKTAYFATDASGKTHTRNSDRVYTHTVVFQSGETGKARKLAAASSKVARDQDGRNYDYQVACAAGTHDHVTSVTPASGYHASFTAEQVAARQQSQRDENARRIAQAKEEIGTMTKAEYLDSKQAARIAAIEAIDFTVWHNAGWCGRLDLAQKLAAKFDRINYNAVAILPAQAK